MPLNDFRVIPRAEYDVLREAGRFPYSASQIATFRECPRKWFFSSILKIPRPSSGAAELGGSCHTAWEAYLQHGTRSLPPKGTRVRKIVEATLKHLPLPGCSEVERDERLDSPFGIGTARIDGLVLRPEDFPQSSVPHTAPGVPMVFDHKTTSSLQYAKTPVDLLGDGSRECPGDAQAVLYGVVARLLRPEAEDVDLFWSYVSTKNAETRPVRVRQSLPVLQSGLGFLEEDLRSMASSREAPSALDVPYDQSACDNYGGCPFKDRCPAGQSNVDYAAIFLVPSPATPKAALAAGDSNMSMAALFGVKPAAPSPTPAPAPAPAATPAPAPAPAATPAAAPAPALTPSLMSMAQTLGVAVSVPASVPAATPAPAPTPAPTPAPASEPETEAIPKEETGVEKVPPKKTRPKVTAVRKMTEALTAVAEAVEMTVLPSAPTPTESTEPVEMTETSEDEGETRAIERALQRACALRRFARAEILARTLVALGQGVAE